MGGGHGREEVDSARWKGEGDQDSCHSPRQTFLGITGERCGGSREQGLTVVLGYRPWFLYPPCMCIHVHPVLQDPHEEPEVRQAGPREA